MMRRWTKEEEQYLKAIYKKQPLRVTANTLNRTEHSVYNKALSMGLTQYVTGEECHWTKHSDNDIALARALAAEKMPVPLISEKLDIPRRTLYYYLRNTNKRPTQALT